MSCAADDERRAAASQLLASLYQPYVQVARAVWAQAEATFDGSERQLDAFLSASVQLLASLKQLANRPAPPGIGQVVDSDGSGRIESRRPIGWPLCSRRTVVIHLGDLSLRARNKHVLPLRSGDFYLCVRRSDDSSEGDDAARPVGVSLALRWFDASRDDFGQVTVNPEQLADWLRTSSRSTTFLSLPARLGCSLNLSNCLLMDGASGLVERRPLCWTRAGDATLSLEDNDDPAGASRCAQEAEPTDLIDMTRRPSASTLQSFGRRQTPERGMSCASFASSASAIIDNDSTPRAGQPYAPKDISSIHTAMLAKEFVVFAGACTDSGDSAIVELHPTRARLVGHFVADDVARALGYLHTVHSRAWNDRGKERRSPEQAPAEINGRAPALVLVIDCRQADQPETLEVVRLCWQAFCLLLQWVPASVRRMVWVGFEHDCEMERTVVDDDQNKAQLVKSDSVSLSALHEQLAASNLTMALDGGRDAHGSQWVQFRMQLEAFLRSTRALGELYIELHKELRRVSARQLWSMDAADLDALRQSLSERKARIESSDCFRFVRDEGESALHNLNSGYPDLATFGVDYYIKAVEKASGLYEEVRRIMDKASTTIDRRCTLLDRHFGARQFLLQAHELIHWADSVALPTASRQENEPSVSLMRLRIQDRQFEQFVCAAKQRLEAGEQLVLDHEWVKQNDTAFTEEQRGELCDVWNRLAEKTDETRCRLKEVRDRLADNLVCHHMLDRVYDWALHNAKWSSQLRLLISTAACSSSTGPEELKGLLESVNQQINSYPAEELRQLPLYATRLSNEQVHSQAQSLATKCSAALEMLNKHEQQLKSMISDMPDIPIPVVKARSVSPAETEYEEPIRRTNPPALPLSAPCREEELTEQQVRWRRSSYAGTASTASTSFDRVADFYDNHENRYRPSQRWSKTGSPPFDAFDEGPSDPADTSASHEDLTSGVITLDMTDQVISSMSANTLQKKISERRAAATGPLPPPNPLALLKGVRSGSARYVSKTKKPFRKLMKRSCTVEGVLEQNLTARHGPLIDSTPLPLILADNRHSSLASLTSIGEESVHSASTESWSEAVRLTSTSGNGAAHDDNCEGSCSLSWSPTSRTDEPIVRVKALALDDYRSESPPPGVTPDQRMQHMILNELLQTEISYVKSLGHVIECYLPEMLRDDLPQELRGQRYTIFGNLEKIYEFHVNDFLSELHRRIHKQTDSMCLEIGKLFLEYRARFHLYALYNKNKPKSDVLMGECGSVFFRTRQLMLEDKLDLSSLLLKPVQRMGKYALLLQQLLKACNCSDQEACDALRRAEEMVSFQLRHGNDLLAMDLITRCDVNLKEQGALLRQDEFTVIESRGLHHRKCVRRVFLFEYLVLFAKPKRRRGASPNASSAARLLADTYQYKYSIQMSDCGLTEKVGDSNVKFELWFRRHTSSSTYVLTAALPSVRETWVNEIAKLLWRQAIRNREQRLHELTNMGIGDRSSCVDLHASVDRIEDRSVNSSLLSRMARFRNSFVGLTSRDHSSNNAATGKRPHSLISLGSSSCTSSNASSLGSAGGTMRPYTVTPGSTESGIGSDLGRLDEESPGKYGSESRIDTLPRGAPPPPPESQSADAIAQLLSSESAVVVV